MKQVALTAIGLGISILMGYVAKPAVATDNPKILLVARQQIAQKRAFAKPFLGLWRAVDPLDGGLITVSITDNDRDRKLKLRFNDTFIRLCQPEAGTAKTGRGISEGIGTVDRNILNAPSTVKCFDSNNAVVDSVEVDWKLKLVRGTLELTGTAFGDNAVIFHKISK